MNRYRLGRSRERKKVVLCEGMGREWKSQSRKQV